MSDHHKSFVDKIENNYSIKTIQKLFSISNSKHDKKFDGLYKLCHDKDLLYIACENICYHYGSSTPGYSKETMDKMTLKIIEEISNELKNRTYQFSPFRKIMIDKPSKSADKKNRSKKQHAFTISEWKDNIVQETLRLILNAIYEPIFYNQGNNFGFRPKLSCQHAVKYLDENAKGLYNALEGDIEDAYGNVDFKILLTLLKEKITDHQFLKLIKNSLHYGLVFKDHYQDTLLGVPQRSIVSPLFFNIYMHEFDKYVLNELTNEFIQQEKKNKKYEKSFILSREKNYKSYKTVEHQKCHNQLQKFTSYFNEHRPNLDSSIKKEIFSSNLYQTKRKQYNLVKQNLQKTQNMNLHKDNIRIQYIRYADDWIILSNCHENVLHSIKEKCKNFLKQKLKLTLSEDKTKITNLYKEEAKFLGFTISCNKGFNKTFKDFLYFDKKSGKSIRLKPRQIYDGIKMS